MTTLTQDWIGRSLSEGRYRITAKLGEGGMGQVYRAFDTVRQADVVIKAPKRSLAEDGEFVARFIREVRAMAKLKHPHIVPVLDVGKHDGIPFAVMEFFPGASLEARRPLSLERKPLPQMPHTLRDWLPGVADALDFIHRHRVVHRDVKPANIFFNAQGKALLGDFGIAKVLADARGEHANLVSLTSTGILLGTPQYMAPELIMGQPFDGRADQFALAVTVYELLCGRPPFDGATPSAVMVNQATQPLRPMHQVVPSVPAELSRIVEKALAKELTQRFPSCGTFAHELMKTLPETSKSPATEEPVRSPTGNPTIPETSFSTPAGSRRVSCTSCGQPLLWSPSLENKRFRCPSCLAVMFLSADGQAGNTDTASAQRVTPPTNRQSMAAQGPLPLSAAQPPPLPLLHFPREENEGGSGLSKQRKTWVWLGAIAVLFIVGGIATYIAISHGANDEKEKERAWRSEDSSTRTTETLEPQSKPIDGSIGSKPSKPVELPSRPAPNFPQPTKPIEKPPDPFARPKDPAFSHGLVLKARKHNEADFNEKTTKFGVECYLDENNGLSIYICETGSIAVVPGAPVVTGAPKEAKFSHGLVLKSRRHDEADFTKDTKKVGVECYTDLNTNYTIYITETGVITAVKGGTPAGGGIKDATFSHGLILKARKHAEADFNKNTTRFGLECYKDGNNGLSLYISESGSIAASPKAAAMPPSPVKDAKFVYGLVLKARKSEDTDFEKSTKYGVESYNDENNANAIHITENGVIVALEGKFANPAGRVADAEYKHGLVLKARKYNEDNFDNSTRKHNIECYGDGNSKFTIYITEAGNVAVIR